MMMIVRITFNSSLVPLIEGLWSSNPLEFEFSGFRRNRTDDLGTNSPSLWPTEPRLHVRSDCGSQFTSPADATIVQRPQLWRAVSVCYSLYHLTRAHCAQCSHSIPLWLASQVLAPAGGRTQSPYLALRIPVSHGRQRVCHSFLLVHHKLFELGVEVAFNNRSADTYNQINPIKFPLQSSCSERNDSVALAYLLLLLSPCRL